MTLLPPFLPTTDDELIYEFRLVGVVGFTASKKTGNVTWFVQDVNACGRVELDLSTVKASTFPLEQNQHTLQRVNLCFAAEDPENYVQRVAEAVKHRNEAEAILRTSLYIDSMPLENIQTNQCIEEIQRRTGCDTSEFKNPEIESKIQKQVLLVEKRAENRMIFESETGKMDDASFIQLKPEISENLHVGKLNKVDIFEEINKAKQLGYNFEGQRKKFQFQSLYRVALLKS